MRQGGTKTEAPVLTQRFVEALRYAAELHQFQRRKGKGQPYVGHLLGVAAIVIQHGGGEDQVIAALLHDAVEDQGGLPRLDEMWMGARTPMKLAGRNAIGERESELILRGWPTKQRT